MNEPLYFRISQYVTFLNR